MKCTESPAGNVCYMNWRPGEIVEMNNYYPFGLLHNYTVTTQNAYQYKYQGQELQETGFYSFKWRNYMPDVARFFNIDPLAEKYPTWGPYVFSGNRVIDARELEGLEAVVLTNIEGKMIVDFHVKVTPKSDMTTQNINDHLSYVSTILSQNSGLQINMINNPKATFGLDMTKPYQSKKTTFYKDGKVKIEMILGEARVGNPINQTITSNGTPKVTAHEIAHTLGLEHIWEDPNVSNTPENIKNLQNSDGNIISDMQENSGTDILPQQVEKMKKVIEASQARINKDELTKTNKDETTK